MATPITLETQVGYVVAEDVYVSYSEYYGDGTIYGRVDLLMPDGSPVKGAGKTKTELVVANVILSENGIGTVTGDIVVVANEPVAVPEENVVPPVVEASNTAEVKEESKNNRYTVSCSFLGFEITREFAVKIDEETRKIYLS